MPQLYSGNARFKFRQINVTDAFVKAKTDMVYLSEGVLSPSEVRKERGLNPDGVVEAQATEENVNISGGKNQDKSEESERTEQRDDKIVGMKPAANKSGNREQ